MFASDEIKPKAWGIRAIKLYWKDDLKAGLSVSLVALPLGLGIALASGAPAMSGLIPAILGGLITTFIRGSHIGINGPSAGQIVVFLAALEMLRDENGDAFRYVLAAVVVSGIIQAILGILKQGKLGELFPSAVIQGMLAAIGVIIFAKQTHVALGVTENSESAMDALLLIPSSLLNLNPFVTLISLLSLGILVFYPRISNRYIRLFPAPLLVLVVSIPVVFFFNHYDLRAFSFMGHTPYIERSFLIDIPENILTSIIFPDFSKIGTLGFWMAVITITLVASIETLISTKAVDRLDNQGRKTNLNKDLCAVGISTAVSGMLGGLPIITVILRSSVNINHGGKTRWSNFYHGLFILMLVLLVPDLIREIPKASLATILVYSGYKLASPRVFRKALLKGWEQLVLILITLIATLETDILWGIIIGVISTLLIQWMKSELQFSTFFSHLLSPTIEKKEEGENTVYIEFKGICNFLMSLKIQNELSEVPKSMNIVIDFAKSKIVDSSALEHIFEYKEKYYSNGQTLDIIGLDNHKTSSSHPQALHILDRPVHQRLTSRQNQMLHLSRSNGFLYKPEINWEVSHLKRFRFFEHKLLDYYQNMMKGRFEDVHVAWEICDVSYNEGILLAAEGHHITLMMLKFGHKIPNFFMGRDNINQLKTMWKEYVKSNDENTSAAIFTTELIHFLLDHESYNIDARGSRVLIYKKQRLASFQEIQEMMDFSHQLIELLQPEIENGNL